MKMCFLDTENSENVSDPLWEKSPSRLFLQCVYSHFSKINGSGPRVIPMFTKEKFWKAMQKYIEENLTYSPNATEDTTVVWSTLPSRQYHQLGLCFAVRFDSHRLLAAAPIDTDRTDVELSSVTNSAFFAMAGIDPWDKSQALHPDRFSKMFYTKVGDQNSKVTLLIIGKLYLYYMIRVLLDLATRKDSSLLNDSVKFFTEVRNRIVKHPIAAQYHFGHLYPSGRKARDATTKNHSYGWSKMNRKDQFDLTFIERSFKFGGNAKMKVSNWKFILSGFRITEFSRACQQLCNTGQIDTSLRDYLLSYGGVSSDDHQVDQLVNLDVDISSYYEEMLEAVFRTGIITPKVMKALLLVRLLYLQKQLPLLELFSHHPVNIAMVEQKERDIGDWFYRVRPHYT
jgi:hypothetical protein